MKIGDGVYANIDQEHAQGLYLGQPENGSGYWVLDLNQFDLSEDIDIITAEEIEPACLVGRIRELAENEKVQDQVQYYIDIEVNRHKTFDL